MSINESDIGYELHLEDLEIEKLHEEWKILQVEVQFNNKTKDNKKIKRVRDIENEIFCYKESRSGNVPDWIKNFEPLTKENKPITSPRHGKKYLSVTDKQIIKDLKPYFDEDLPLGYNVNTFFYKLVDKYVTTYSKIKRLAKENHPKKTTQK